MTIRWELPASWSTRLLGEVAPEDSSQVTPLEHATTSFNYWGLDAIGKNQFVEPAPNYVLGSQISSTCVRFDVSHVLYCKLRPYLNKVIVPTMGGIGSTEWVTLKPIPEIVDRSYLAWVLRTALFINYADASSTGARMPRANKSALREADVPLPFPDDPIRSLAEQRRIVARIEALFAELREGQDIHKAIVADTNRLMDAILADLFPSPDEAMPEGWVMTQIKDIAGQPQYGYTQSAKTLPIGPKFLRITDIQNGKVNWGAVPYCECTAKDLQKYRLETNDIVFARSGATTGKTYLISEPPEAVFASYLIRLKVHGAVPSLVHWFFQSPHYWRQIVLRGGAQPNMNAKLLQEIKLALPKDRVQQQQISTRLDSVHSELVSMQEVNRQDSALLQEIEQAILAQAFRGEL